MSNMKDIQYVSALKSNFHTVFDTPQGKEVLDFLEKTCCWRQTVWNPSSPELTLINDGKRQVLSTIKTFLECSPEQISQVARNLEEY